MTPGKPFLLANDIICTNCGCLESRHLVSGPVPGLRPCAGGCIPHCSNFEAETQDDTEQVNHPSHYGGADNPYEAIRVMEAWAMESGWDPVQITNITMAMKYIRRHGQKAIAPAPQDLEKACWHINRVILHLRGLDV